MKHHEVIQGTPDWDDLRLNHFTASEAPVIMASSKNQKRNDLMEAKATQSPKEFSSFVIDVVFEKGHETEALARPIVEEMYGEEFFPVTGSDHEYLASFDGLTMMDNIAFEHKQWNADLAAMVKAKELPDFIIWQIEHQLLVGADCIEKIVFVVSNGTKENFEWMEYTSSPERRAQLIAGWDQFEKDLIAFKPKEKKAEAVGKTPQSLPALVIDISGELTTQSNLDAFKTSTMELIAGIKTELITDQDFANAGSTVKFLGDAEKQSEMVKAQALSKTANLENLFIAIDEMKELMRSTRLGLKKKVETDKKNRKTALVNDGNEASNAHIIEVNKEFEGHRLQITGVDFDLYTSIKGMSSFDNMESVIDDEVARFKIECNQRAANIRNSLAILNERAGEHMFLFPNKQELVAMESDYLKLTIDSRISQYKEEEQAKEQKRIGGHKESVASLDLDNKEFPDDMSLSQLQSQHGYIQSTNTQGLEEFKERAEANKNETLSYLRKRITAKNAELEAYAKADRVAQQEVQSTATEETSAPAPKAEIPREPVSHDDAMPGHDDPVEEAQAESDMRATVTEIVYAMRQHLEVKRTMPSPSKLTLWMDALDHTL